MNLKDENSLREILRILERKLGLLNRSEASCCNTTLSQCHALVEIGRVGELTLNELAETLVLDKSTMSRTINNLVDANLVTREIHPEDRRYITIKLTKTGDEFYRKTESSMNEYFQKVLNSIPEEKRECVIESLQLLINAINENKCC